MLTRYERYLTSHPELDTVLMSDPKPAMEAITQKRFDLVFTDLEMPTFSGFDILDALDSAGFGKAYLVTGHIIRKEDVNSSALLCIFRGNRTSHFAPKGATFP